jgi:hypothetical protein
MIFAPEWKASGVEFLIYGVLANAEIQAQFSGSSSELSNSISRGVAISKAVISFYI